MVFDNVCSTKLSLCLGSNDMMKINHLQVKNIKTTSQRFDDQYLSLRPSGFSFSTLVHGHEEAEEASSILSAVSSFSNCSVKREREVSRDLKQVGTEDPYPTRKKLRLTKDQSLVLEDSFKEHHTLTSNEKQALANMLNLKPRQVEVWFQNRRARMKLKQTEIDAEILKKCCESLKEENRRLQKELQDLKARKLTPRPVLHAAAGTGNRPQHLPILSADQ